MLFKHFLYHRVVSLVGMLFRTGHLLTVDTYSCSKTSGLRAVTEAEIELATALNVPLLGASPPVVAAVQAKAGSRALFQRARMNVAPGLCVQPVDGTSEVLGAQDAVQALDDLSMAGWGRRSKSEAAGNAPGGRSVLGGGRANMKVSFTLRDGDLVVKDKRGDTPTNMNERKDRILCEHIAKAMLLSGAKTIQVCA